MLNKTQLFVLSFCITSLTGCVTTQKDNDAYYKSVNYVYTPLYPEGYELGGNYNFKPEPESKVTVPESYHVSAYHPPTPPKDVDRSWVSNQNPQHYTIELANAESPATVAKALADAPKSQRMAEIKYERNGQTWYKGYYGSYTSYEEAETALKALPAPLQQSAGIKTWSGAQS